MADLYSDVYPESWWMLMPAGELKPGQARAVDVLGRNLVVYRSDSGELAAMDRFCPHMGASLAAGKVVGDRIVCPFHAWEYGRDGRCAHIPTLADGARIPPSVRTPAIPVTEHIGWIWLYHGDRAAYALPEIPEASDSRWWIRQRTQRFRMHPLLIIENAADLAHFRTVHKVEATHVEWELLRDEAHCFEFSVTQELPKSDGGSSKVTTQFLYPGAGCIFGTLIFGTHRVARFVAAPIPLGNGEIDFHLLVIGRKLKGWRSLLNPIYAWYLSRKLFKGSTDDYLPVWQHMDPRRRRVLLEQDRLQQKLRQYYRALMPDTARRSAEKTSTAETPHQIGGMS